MPQMTIEELWTPAQRVFNMHRPIPRKDWIVAWRDAEGEHVEVVRGGGTAVMLRNAHRARGEESQCMSYASLTRHAEALNDAIAKWGQVLNDAVESFKKFTVYEWKIISLHTNYESVNEQFAMTDNVIEDQTIEVAGYEDFSDVNEDDAVEAAFAKYNSKKYTVYGLQRLAHERGLKGYSKAKKAEVARALAIQEVQDSQ